MAPTVALPPKLSSVKRFYLLQYFYVLLRSVERYCDYDQVFEAFRVLKQEHRLGESKYRIRPKTKAPSPGQLDRYRYTFSEVIDESIDYGLLVQQGDRSLHLTEPGRELLAAYLPNDYTEFNLLLFQCMERRYEAFYHIVRFAYSSNRKHPGSLIFPYSSPSQLGFERASVVTTGDVVRYSSKLVEKLEREVRTHLDETRDFVAENNRLLEGLFTALILPRDESVPFDPIRYNVITKRIRDHWLEHFLNKVYGYPQSASSFERWIYRGKQIGIIHATDFYPNFIGRLVYPTSAIARHAASPDFCRVYQYADGQALYMHRPQWEGNRDRFVDALVEGYFTLRRPNRSYFINLLALREVVCYNLQIPEHVFDGFLEQAYKLNLAGDLKIRISLEVDKLPEETNAMYLKREPVMIDGKYRNIIGVDVTKGARW